MRIRIRVLGVSKEEEFYGKTALSQKPDA